MEKHVNYPDLENIFNAAIDGIIIIDDRGNMLTINPAAEHIFGYEEHELINQNVSMLMPMPEKKEHDSYINNYKTTGHKKIIGIGREVKGIKKDGTIFPFRLSISESKLNGQTLFTGIVHDITELKEVQNKLETSNKELEERVEKRTEELTKTVNKLLTAKNRLEKEITLRKKTEVDLEEALIKEKELGILKSRFVTMASHEFRTPLSTILSSASLISKYTETIQQNKRDKHISKIKASVKNMTNVLEDILSLGKIEEGKIDNAPQIFELNQFIHDVIDQIQPILKADQSVIIDGKVPKIVNWDKKLTENVLMNLLSNAIKYSNEGDNIDINYKEEKEVITISIKDKGIGIPKKQQKHLFDRFFRASNATNIKGTGLGLHIVKEYLNLMNGEIAFKSKEGIGSTFYIRIPKNHL